MSDEQITPYRVRDWYLAPKSVLDYVRGVPGFRGERDKLLIHRTHLPLLPEALRPALRLQRNANDQYGDITLRPYQHRGVEYIRDRRGTLLAWQMRTGKTATSLSSYDLDHGPLVILAPRQARTDWIAWIKRRWPDASLGVIEGLRFDPKAVQGKQVLFLHFEIARAWQMSQVRWGMTIIDEAHLLTSPKSWRLQAARLYAATSEQVVLLTGTPVWNKPAGLYNLLQLVNGGAWGRWRDYAWRYTNGRLGEYGIETEGTSNEPEFIARLTEVMSCLKWQDVMPDLPPIERSIVTVPVDADDLLDLAKLAEALRGGPSTVRSTAGEIAHARKTLGQIKWLPAVNQAKKYLDVQEPVIVWTWHRAIAQAIHKELERQGYGAFLVTGAETSRRDCILDAWRDAPSAALVITLAVGQVAINLSHARHCVFAEEDWTPAVMSQAEYRPFLPDRPMTADYIVAEHPIDMKIVTALVQKCQAAAQIGVAAAETQVDLLESALGLDASSLGLDGYETLGVG